MNVMKGKIAHEDIFEGNVGGTGYTKKHTPAEVAEAYEQLIRAQWLIDTVLRTGFDGFENTAEIEDSLLSTVEAIFEILKDFLENTATIMDDLNMGYEQAFTEIWKGKHGNE